MTPPTGRRFQLPFIFRGKRLFSASLRLAVHEAALADVLGGQARELTTQALPVGLDGQLLSGVVDQGWRTCTVLDDRIAYVLSRDVWHYLAWTGCYDRFLEGRFTAKSRESFARDEARFIETFGVAEGRGLDLRVYRSPAEMAEFLRHAALVGGSVDGASLARAAAQGTAHGFVLFAKGVPAAYLCLEANGEALQYACAGERPDYRQWSAGSIVHLQAFQRLFADVRYRFVDFRPGDNEVKRQFANGSLRSAVVLQVPRTLRNRVLLGLHAMLQRASGNERCAAEVSDEVRTLLASRA